MQIVMLLVAGMAFTMGILNFLGLFDSSNLVTGLLWLAIGINNVQNYKNEMKKKGLH